MCVCLYEIVLCCSADGDTGTLDQLEFNEFFVRLAILHCPESVMHLSGVMFNCVFSIALCRMALLPIFIQQCVSAYARSTGAAVRVIPAMSQTACVPRLRQRHFFTRTLL